jgi:hypothetical protein
MPAFPKGRILFKNTLIDQRPPSPLAKFQNNLGKIEQTLFNSKGASSTMKGTYRANSSGNAFG